MTIKSTACQTCTSPHLRCEWIRDTSTEIGSDHISLSIILSAVSPGAYSIAEPNGATLVIGGDRVAITPGSTFTLGNTSDCAGAFGPSPAPRRFPNAIGSVVSWRNRTGRRGFAERVSGTAWTIAGNPGEHSDEMLAEAIETIAGGHWEELAPAQSSSSRSLSPAEASTLPVGSTVTDGRGREFSVDRLGGHAVFWDYDDIEHPKEVGELVAPIHLVS